MTWQTLLPERSIRRLDLLPGKPPLLAVWPRYGQARFFDVRDGLAQGEMKLDIPAGEARSGAGWQRFLSSLKAPNEARLPFVRTPALSLYNSSDGRLRLYHAGGAELFLDDDGEEIKLDTGGAAHLVALAFDPLMGVIAALDEQVKLHIFQQNITVGVFASGLTLHPELQPSLAMAHNGSALFACDGQKIVRLDNGGAILKTRDAHYYVGQMACSPDGAWLATSDLESGVLRLYDGQDLTPTHQRFAADLLERAQVEGGQAVSIPESVTISALALSNQATVAFALSGCVCLCEIEAFDALPRPQRLL
ncbi:MAG: hypothetical protein HXY40_12780 [Chloroflexi bacterium]|nr:hypothetical protein [Chloroflexota bacterium]